LLSYLLPPSCVAAAAATAESAAARCIEAVIVRDKPSCPLCRTHITSSNLIDPPPPEESKPAADDAAAAAAAGNLQDPMKSTAAAVAASSKIQALLMKLRETEAETAQVGNGTIACISGLYQSWPHPTVF
jgi:hypothetical protein